MGRKNKSFFSTPILIILGLIIVAGVVKLSGAGNRADADESSGTLTVSETSWNLGSVSMRDGINTKKVTITNGSDAPVTITRMETSCMCTKATVVRDDGVRGATKGMAGHGGTPYLTEVIEPGEVVTLEVDYDPNAHGPNAVGPISRTITLNTDSTDRSTIKLRFSGIVVK